MAEITRDMRPAFNWEVAHERQTKEKLFLWSQLCRQCDQLELQLNSANSICRDRDAIEAKLAELRERATAVFKEAARALRNADVGTGPPDHQAGQIDHAAGRSAGPSAASSI